VQADDDMAKKIDPSIEELRKKSAAMAWGGAAPEVVAATAAEEGAAAAPAGQKEMSEMSLEELEAELARRKAASS